MLFENRYTYNKRGLEFRTSKRNTGYGVANPQYAQLNSHPKDSIQGEVRFYQPVARLRTLIITFSRTKQCMSYKHTLPPRNLPLNNYSR